MKTVFVNLKSEVTVAKTVLEAIEFKVYRTRTHCDCVPGQNRRDAIVAIHADDRAYQVKVIRCKSCRKGADYEDL